MKKVFKLGLIALVLFISNGMLAQGPPPPPPIDQASMVDVRSAGATDVVLNNHPVQNRTVGYMNLIYGTQPSGTSVQYLPEKGKINVTHNGTTIGNSTCYYEVFYTLFEGSQVRWGVVSITYKGNTNPF